MEEALEQEAPKEIIPELIWIRHLTSLMDSRFRVPGTKFRFGLDPLFGLVPILGDILTLLISSLMVVAMARHGISSKVFVLMILNITVDFLLGFIPFFGDAFDFVNRSNTRNYKLLQGYYEEGEHTGSGWWIIWMILLFMVFLIVGLIWLAVKLLGWTYEYVF